MIGRKRDGRGGRDKEIMVEKRPSGGKMTAETERIEDGQIEAVKMKRGQQFNSRSYRRGVRDKRRMG